MVAAWRGVAFGLWLQQRQCEQPRGYWTWRCSYRERWAWDGFRYAIEREYVWEPVWRRIR